MIETSIPSEHRHDTRERSCRSRFSEQICQLVLGRDVDHRDDRSLDQVLNSQKPQLEVLGPIPKFTRIIGKALTRKGAHEEIGSADTGSADTDSADTDSADTWFLLVQTN